MRLVSVTEAGLSNHAELQTLWSVRQFVYFCAKSVHMQVQLFGMLCILEYCYMYCICEGVGSWKYVVSLNSGLEVTAMAMQGARCQLLPWQGALVADEMWLLQYQYQNRQVVILHEGSTVCIRLAA